MGAMQLGDCCYTCVYWTIKTMKIDGKLPMADCIVSCSKTAAPVICKDYQRRKFCDGGMILAMTTAER